MRRRSLDILPAFVEKREETKNVGDMHLSLFPVTHEKRSWYVAPSSYHDLYPEYWLVDPDDHVVERFVLRGGQYQLVGRHTDEIHTQTIDGVRVNLKEVW